MDRAMNAVNTVEAASTAIHLFIGLEKENNRLVGRSGEWPTMKPDEGFMGMTTMLARRATQVVAFCDAEGPDAEYPGAFDYEVTQPMGAWLNHNINCTDAEFKAELTRCVANWREFNVYLSTPSSPIFERA